MSVAAVVTIACVVVFITGCFVIRALVRTLKGPARSWIRYVIVISMSVGAVLAAWLAHVLKFI